MPWLRKIAQYEKLHPQTNTEITEVCKATQYEWTCISSLSVSFHLYTMECGFSETTLSAMNWATYIGSSQHHHNYYHLVRQLYTVWKSHTVMRFPATTCEFLSDGKQAAFADESESASTHFSHDQFSSRWGCFGWLGAGSFGSSSIPDYMYTLICVYNEHWFWKSHLLSSGMTFDRSW